MKNLRLITEKILTWLLTFSGAITTLTIVFITIFLFKEGAGLFKQPNIESGYALCLNSKNIVEELSAEQINKIFNEDITNWKEVGGNDSKISVVWFEDIFEQYPEEAFGENYSKLPEKLGSIIDEDENIITCLPEKYIPTTDPNVKVLDTKNINPKEFFGGKDWMPTATPAPQFGVLPLIWGTLLVSIFAIIIALPLGLGVAVYMSELASNRIRKILKPTIELLAGIPSVVYGFFGLVVLVPITQKLLGLDVGETAFVGALLLAIMALPTIISIAEDAMRNTPRAMREASLALGSTKWQTIYKVVIPYASSGITAGVVLGIGRAIGETMAVMMVTGNAATMPFTLFEPVRTIPATIAAELGEAPTGGTHYQALFLLGAILFVITLIINLSAEYISKRGRAK